MQNFIPHVPFRLPDPFVHYHNTIFHWLYTVPAGP